MATGLEFDETHYNAGYADGLAELPLYTSYKGRFPNQKEGYREGYNDAVPERLRREALINKK